jgi:S-methylmethionine-dependent homocysteine/selenocysteine methylase
LCLRYVASGATIVGGCCGISPEDIGALSQALADRS